MRALLRLVPCLTPSLVAFCKDSGPGDTAYIYLPLMLLSLIAAWVLVHQLRLGSNSHATHHVAAGEEVRMPLNRSRALTWLMLCLMLPPPLLMLLTIWLALSAMMPEAWPERWLAHDPVIRILGLHLYEIRGPNTHAVMVCESGFNPASSTGRCMMGCGTLVPTHTEPT